MDLFLDLFFVEFVHRPARVEAAVGELLLVGGLLFPLHAEFLAVEEDGAESGQSVGIAIVGSGVQPQWPRSSVHTPPPAIYAACVAGILRGVPP